MFAEHLKYLCDLFDYWVRDKEINDYKKIRDLVILENLLHTIPQDIADYLTDKFITNLVDIPDVAANHSIFLCKREGRPINVGRPILL